MKTQTALLDAPGLPRSPVVNVRIVIRRGTSTTRRIDQALRSGEFPLNTGCEDVCELVANGTVIAVGRIIERDGELFFEGEKNEHS